ncbi:MAG: hypothetical protein ACOYM3_24615, partial [Terrimicrobiaceae bacterium]
MKINSPNEKSGMTLVITLIMLSLLSILVVGLLVVTRLELATATNHFEKRRAEAIAAMGSSVALGKIRTALDRFQVGTYNDKFWSVEPGRIAVFDTASPANPEFIDLISALPTGNSTTEVNLNKANLGGRHPISESGGPGGAAPAMPVGWVNVLADPTVPASATNQIVGRYAF